jgi:histidinol dehydrogenase
VRVERVSDGAQLRGLAVTPPSVTAEVTEIIAEVRETGDAALLRFADEFDGVKGSLHADATALKAAINLLESDVRAGLEAAIANVRAVAAAQLSEPREIALEQGHSVTVREEPVGRAAIYAPGGRNPYPSTVVMGVITANVAGVQDVVVCVPKAHPVMLAAAALCEADEVLVTGGAHTIAALAYGTDSVRRADVIAGPGGPHVQEAKRQLFGTVGIDMFAGPSDLMIVAEAGVADDAVVADLLAQAEHGEGSLAVLVSSDAALLDRAAGEAAEHGGEATIALLQTDEALPVIVEFAPEHLQLVGPGPEALAPRVRNAGCVLIGPASGTAFSDYIAGSNHTLPTAGSARFASGLGPGHFRRKVSEVRISAGAADRLAATAVPIAEAEGFTLHARSMALRENGET